MTTPVNSWQSAANGPMEFKGNGRFWLEFLTSCFAWHFLAAINVLLAYGACAHQEQLGGASYHPGVRILYFVLWIAFFGLAVWTGIMSYRTWRSLSQTSELLRAEGRERREYMSLCGLFISVTLGVGMVWMCVPLFMLKMCLRIR